MTVPMFLSILIGTVIPLINGLVTKYAATKTRVYLQIILSAVAGFATQAFNGGATYNWTAGGMAAILTLVTALAVEAKIWAPLGVSEALKKIGSEPSAPETTNPMAG
jgi:hypothetical protein